MNPVKTGLAYVEDVMIECCCRLRAYANGGMPFDRDQALRMVNHLDKALGLNVGGVVSPPEGRDT